jgi:hypothetical protein
METETGTEAGEPSRSTGSGAETTPFAPVAPTPQLPPAPPLPTYPSASPYGYPQYGYGYGYYPQPQPPHGTNGNAIASLVLGICGFAIVTPIVGLVLGLVALSSVRESGQKGKRMAISGIVLSSAWIAVIAVLITVGVANQPEPAHRDANGTVVAKGIVPVFDLHPQDCFTLPPGLMGSTDSKIRTFTVVPCSTPHDSEAIGSYTPTGGSYPGADTLRTDSMSQCLSLLDTYIPDQASLTGSRIEFIFPNEQAWGAGENRVLCFLQFPAAPVTQSVHRDRSSYTPDQLSYLDAVRPVIDTVSQLNATDQSADLSVLQQRAGDVTTALRGEITALTTDTWPADVQPDVDALVAEHRAATDLLAKAADATDAGSYVGSVRQALGDLDFTDMNAIRTGLGLTAVTPGSTGSPGSVGSSQQAA